MTQTQNINTSIVKDFKNRVNTIFTQRNTWQQTQFKSANDALYAMLCGATSSRHSAQQRCFVVKKAITSQPTPCVSCSSISTRHVGLVTQVVTVADARLLHA